MKKILMLMSCIALVTITACSSDDSSNSSTSDVLVKRIVYNDSDFTYEATFSYNGNKLTKVVYDDGSQDKYYYTGNLITKIEYIVDDEVEEREVFTYNTSGMLIEASYQDLFSDFEEKSTFTSVNATTITESYYGGAIGSTTLDGTATLTLTNGELTQKAQNGGDVYTYTYDNKNSPFKNVTGWAAIADFTAGDHELEGRVHNIASIHNDTAGSNYTTNTYTYNSSDYPLTVTSVAIFDADFPGDVSTASAQYFYE
jgi:hypothetical protein